MVCRIKHTLAAGLLVSFGLLPIRGLAQEVPVDELKPEEQAIRILQGGMQGIEPAQSVPSRWIGVEVYPVKGLARAQLKLPEGQGLGVAKVVENSPAAKAGIQEFDIILKVNDKPMGDVPQLLEILADEKATTMNIIGLRAGQGIAITVTPENRPANPGLADAGPANPALGEYINIFRNERGGKAIAGGGGSAGGYGAFFVGPEGKLSFLGTPPAGFPEVMGMARPAMAPGTFLKMEGPKGRSLEIQKGESGPAKITAKVGDKTYETTEDQLDKLPPEVQADVRRLTGGHLAKPMIAAPPMPGTVIPLQSRSFEALERRIDAMQRELQNMKEHLKPPAAPAPNQGLPDVVPFE